MLYNFIFRRYAGCKLFAWSSPIHNLVEASIDHPTNRSFSIPSLTQVLACLRFFASGSFQNIVGDIVGVSQSSVSRILHAFVEAMKPHAGTYIRFPLDSPEWVQQTKNFYVARSGFPDVLGVVDGCHFLLKKPHVDGDTFYNRKGRVSINTQVIHFFCKCLTLEW